MIRQNRYPDPGRCDPLDYESSPPDEPSPGQGSSDCMTANESRGA